MKEMEKKSRTKKNLTTAVQSGATETNEPRKSPKKATPAAKAAPAGMPANGTDPGKKMIRKKATPKVTEIGVSREEIAKLAHRFWNERGRAHGHDAEDWLRAERELRGMAS